MKKILFFFVIGFAFSQKINNQSIENTELFKVIETASRSQQSVFIEMFTGLNWTYCPAVSFMYDTLQIIFPTTLKIVE